MLSQLNSKPGIAVQEKPDYNVSTWISLNKNIMRLQIGKWGNSLAVRLPAVLLKKIFLKEGDTLEASIEPDGTLHLFPAHGFNKKKFFTKLDKLHQNLPCTEPVIETLRREQRY